MARLKTCGFEINSTTNGMEWDTTTGSPTISTAIKKSGASSLRCNPTAATAFITDQYMANGTAIGVYIQWDMYIATLPASTILIAKGRDNDWPIDKIGLKLTAAGKLQLFDMDSATQVGSDSATLNTGQMYRICLYQGPDSGGAFTGYINDVQFATGSASGAAGNAEVISIGVLESATCDIYFDNLIINDTSGTNENGIPGAQIVEYLYPMGAGEINTFEKQGGGAGDANNYQSVDENPPDDATSFVRSLTLNQEDLYEFTKLSTSNPIIVKALQVRIRYAGSAGSANSRIKLELEKITGGTKSQGTEINPNASTWKTDKNAIPRLPTLTLYKNPDGGAFDSGQLTTLRAGFILSTINTNYFQASAIWIIVSYNEGASRMLRPNKLRPAIFSPGIAR